MADAHERWAPVMARAAILRQVTHYIASPTYAPVVAALCEADPRRPNSLPTVYVWIERDGPASGPDADVEEVLHRVPVDQFRGLGVVVVDRDDGKDGHQFVLVTADDDIVYYLEDDGAAVEGAIAFAEAVRATNPLAARLEDTRRLGQAADTGVQVMSDIDDTIVCTGGSYGGSDTGYDRHVIYPGAGALMLELSRGPADDEAPPGLLVMSARFAETPVLSIFAGKITEEHPVGLEVARLATATGIDWGLEGGLYGNFLDNLHSSATRAILKGAQKYRNFKRVEAAADVTRRYVFVGDDGEGDALAGLEMASRYGPVMAAVFIHRVKPLEVEPISPDPAVVIYFSNYAEAALEAFRRNLISGRGLRAVADDIRADPVYTEGLDQHEVSAKTLGLTAALEAIDGELE